MTYQTHASNRPIRSIVLCLVTGIAVLSSGCGVPPLAPPLGPGSGDLFPLATLIIGALAGYFAAPAIRSRRSRSSLCTAEQIARARYARGEITPDEFDSIIEKLYGGSHLMNHDH